MALTPTLSFTVQNDNKKITVTDTTVDYGVAGNMNVTDITSLTLDISITSSDNTSISYTQIDLYSLLSGPFASQSELTIDLDPSYLLYGTNPLGTSDDEFPDGVYNIVYTINGSIEKEYDVLLDGRVVNASYELLRLMPQSYLCGNYEDKDVMDVLFVLAMIDSMESSAYVGNNEAILEQLSVIERLITNGSNYTW